MINNYKELEGLLDSVEFKDFYINSISNQFFEINYGSKKGILNFLGVKKAAKNYEYDADSRYSVNIDNQLDILNNQIELGDIYDAEVLMACIEVFDWGQVQKSNVIEALARYRDGSLTSYLKDCKTWFESTESIGNFPINCIWSSGWTKVYSFMFNRTAIYDSRVAAFINYILVEFYRSLTVEKDIEDLVKITSHLISFKGATGRKRYVGSEERKLLRIKGKSTSNEKNMYSNKVASWILEYIAKAEYGENATQSDFRNIDKAAFMLGFDIGQIAPELDFQ
jgi:hypothetical protein